MEAVDLLSEYARYRSKELGLYEYGNSEAGGLA